MLPRALLPNDMRRVNEIYSNILREHGLSRDCEAAEEIARRVITAFQDGIEDAAVLRIIAESVLKREAPVPSDDRGSVTKEEISVRDLANETSEIAEADLKMLQRVFHDTCLWCHISRNEPRAKHLARYMVDQFLNGMTDGNALFESAMLEDRFVSSKRDKLDS